MSGLVGIYEAGVRIQHRDLVPMLERVMLPGEPDTLVTSAPTIICGVSPRWNFQSISTKNNYIAAVSADLCNTADLSAALGISHAEISTAELVLQLYAVFGLKFVDKLLGSFALCLWDGHQQQLLLAVDRLGIESLYWAQDGDRLWFASRIGAIAAVQPDCLVNSSAIVQFLMHTVVPAPMTIYKDVYRLEPGMMLLCTPDRNVTKKKYWDINYSEASSASANDLALQLRAQLRTSVHSHLEGCSAANTGAYLSGGTDSSSVVAFASEKELPFNSFSIYFNNPHYDEISYARMAAAEYQTAHYDECVQAEDAVEAIPRIIDYFDEPFANSSSIGAYRCARLAKLHGMNTLLAGDGGDELFAGNERYASDRKFALYHLVPDAIRTGIIKPFARCLPENGALSLLPRYIRRAELPNPRRIMSYCFLLSNAAQDIFQPDFLQEMPVESWLRIPEAHFHNAPGASSELNRLLYMDVKMTLADNDLRKVRGTAEMAGVNVRFPLLDHRLVEFSGRIPSRLKLKGFQKRYLFKQAMKGTLPEAILHKKKHGFGVPVGYWILHHPLARQMMSILDEPRTLSRGYFRTGFLETVKRGNESYPAYYGDILWVLLVLELWHRRHLTTSAKSGRDLQVVHVN
jgi:asparagine synthase (glutamine-hydrolysing)